MDSFCWGEPAYANFISNMSMPMRVLDGLFHCVLCRDLLRYVPRLLHFFGMLNIRDTYFLVVLLSFHAVVGFWRCHFRASYWSGGWGYPVANCWGGAGSLKKRPLMARFRDMIATD